MLLFVEKGNSRRYDSLTDKTGSSPVSDSALGSLSVSDLDFAYCQFLI